MKAARKIIVYIATSADGYIARPDGDVEWLNRLPHKFDYGMRAFYRSIDTILWGRKTYDWLLAYEKKTGASKGSMFDKKVANYIFSRKPPKSPLPGVEFVSEPVKTFAHRLRTKPGKHIWMMGGGGLIASFLDEGEIDEFDIHVIPAFIGDGAGGATPPRYPAAPALVPEVSRRRSPLALSGPETVLTAIKKEEHSTKSLSPHRGDSVLECPPPAGPRGRVGQGVTDMRSLRLVGFVLALTLPLCAQQYKLNERELGDYKGSDDAVRSVMDYCDMLDAALRQQQPRIFAETKTESSGEAKTVTWGEFAGKDAWQAAGSPAPLAFVWDKDAVIVRVTMVDSPRHGKPSLAQQRLDYCYNDDAQLVRIRAVWYAPTECEFLFPCRLISGHDFLLGGQRPAVTDWVFKEDGTIQRLRNGTAVEDYFDPSYSLTVSDLHLQTSFDLPFARMQSKK